jgi:hypothetical protein
MSTLLDIANQPPPSRSSVIKAVSKTFEEGLRIGTEATAAQVLGIDTAALRQLNSDNANLLMSYQYDDWQVFSCLHDNFDVTSHRGRRTVVITPNGRAATRPLDQLASFWNTLLEENGYYALLAMNDWPVHAIWQQVPAGMIICHLPTNTESLTCKMKVGSLNLRGLANVSPGEDWAEITLDEDVVGWTKDDVVRFRINPYLGNNGRVTASQVEKRQEALRMMAEAAFPQLTHILSDDELPAYINDWQKAIQSTIGEIDVLNSATRTLSNKANEASDKLKRQEDSLNNLRAMLAEAQTKFEEAEETLKAAPQLRQAAAHQAKAMMVAFDTSLAEIISLPQIDSASIDQRGFFNIQTKPLILNCGTSGLREIGTLEISFSVGTQNGATYVRGNHPGIYNNESFLWGNSSLPLAQALGEGLYKQACAIICGALSAPAELAHSDLPQSSSPAGWQS